MKISSSPVSAPAALTYTRSTRTSSASPTAGAAVQVEASSFLSQLSAAAKASPYGDVRPDKVAAARADLAAGRLGTPEDIDATISAFLRDLS